MPNPDVANPLIIANSVINGRPTVSVSPKGPVTNSYLPLSSNWNIVNRGNSEIYTSGVYVKLNNRFDDPTYYG